MVTFYESFQERIILAFFARKAWDRDSRNYFSTGRLTGSKKHARGEPAPCHMQIAKLLPKHGVLSIDIKIKVYL